MDGDLWRYWVGVYSVISGVFGMLIEEVGGGGMGWDEWIWGRERVGMLSLTCSS